MRIARSALLVSVLFLGSSLAAGCAVPSEVDTSAQTSAALGAEARAVFQYADFNDTSAPIRDMPALPPQVRENHEMPRKLLGNRAGSAAPSPTMDRARQTEVTTAVPATGASFEGVNNVNGVLPPDTNGDVGPNHYVQTVNLSYAVWNKSGTKLYGPVDIRTLWQGFAGPCSTRNDGDPIVLYDHLADRWLISQFALPRYPVKPFYQCIAISKTGDPLGAYHRYAFSFNKLNDYPKFGVWPDGYYMAINQFKSGSGGWGGQGVAAFERAKMLNGQPARMAFADLFSLDRNLGGMLPAHLNGATPPPLGAPNPFAVMDDDAWGYSPDQIQLWEFTVNWAASTASFSRKKLLFPAAFDSNLCGYARNCVKQPGGVAVDTLSDRLMYRLQYRNFGSYQALLANHTVDVNGADRAGIRWYELRDTGSGWNIHQQSTYAGADSDNRWMASIAMNGKGEIALGYSVSSTGTYPSIRFTGRLASDPANQMTLGEGSIMAGSGYQSHSSGRWGDYSSMSVDPTDDCTFWFTSEYYAAGASSAGWRTRVGSFQLSTCP